MTEPTESRFRATDDSSLSGAPSARAPYQAPVLIVLLINDLTRSAGGGSHEASVFASVS